MKPMTIETQEDVEKLRELLRERGYILGQNEEEGETHPYQSWVMDEDKDLIAWIATANTPIFSMTHLARRKAVKEILAQEVL